MQHGVVFVIILVISHDNRTPSQEDAILIITCGVIIVGIGVLTQWYGNFSVGYGAFYPCSITVFVNEVFDIHRGAIRGIDHADNSHLWLDSVIAKTII